MDPGGPQRPFHYGPGSAAPPAASPHPYQQPPPPHPNPISPVGGGQYINNHYYYPPLPQRPQVPPAPSIQEPVYDSIPVPLPYQSHTSTTHIPPVRVRNLPPPPLPPRQSPIVGLNQHQVQQSYPSSPAPPLQAPASQYVSAYPQGQPVYTGSHSPSSYHVSTPVAYSPTPLQPGSQPQYSSRGQVLGPQPLYHPPPSPLPQQPQQDANIHSSPPPPPPPPRQQQPSVTQHVYYSPQAVQTQSSPPVHGGYRVPTPQPQVPVQQQQQQQQQTTQSHYQYSHTAQPIASPSVPGGSYYAQAEHEPQHQPQLQTAKADLHYYPQTPQVGVVPLPQTSTYEPNSVPLAPVPLAPVPLAPVSQAVHTPVRPTDQAEISYPGYQPTYSQPPASSQLLQSGLPIDDTSARIPEQPIASPIPKYNPEPHQYGRETLPSDSNNAPAQEPQSTILLSDLTKHLNEMNIQVGNASQNVSSVQSKQPVVSAPDPNPPALSVTRRKPVQSPIAVESAAPIHQPASTAVIQIPITSPEDTPFMDCPKRVTVDVATYWFYHRSTPDFLICSHCYANHISSTKFSISFTREWKKEGPARLCMFHVARMKDVLWPAATTSGDLEPVLQFMKHRLEVKACPGTKRSNSTANIKYFSHVRNEPVDGFIACEACYEDTILAQPFAQDFQPFSLKQTESNFWACDVSVPPVQRAFDRCQGTDSWVNEAKVGCKRIGLPDCPGNRNAYSSSWYKMKKSIDGMVFCDACYYDHFVNTEFEHHFEFAAPPGQSTWACGLSAWSVRIAWNSAIYHHNYAAFWDASYKIMHFPFCSSEPIAPDMWYVLSSQPEGHFNVCPACFEGIFKSWGCGQHFTARHQYSTSKPLICSMWREVPRGGMWLRKYAEALDKLSFSIFDTYVQAICDVPICPRDKPAGNRSWYGYSDALFCEECYRLFVRHTSLADKLELKGEVVTPERICDIYSPRMREKWETACATGDVAPFREYARHRAEVYSRTMPELRMMIEMMQMRMMMGISTQQMAMMAHGGDAINNMAGDVSETWTVSSGGFSGTGGSEFGANAQAMAEKSKAGVIKMNDQMRGAMLEAEWRSVE